jgi:ornithine--oxo-acid transaminase
MNPIELEDQYGANNYHPLPVVLARGEGIYCFDTSGKRYIDMMSAYSALSHGHCHPRLLKALLKQASSLSLTSRAFYSDRLGLFLENACQLTGLPRAIPMNSGAEAVETAIKAARKWAYTVKKIPLDQAEIIVCADNFHGRTTTIISMSSEPQYRSGFGPYTPGFKIIPFGDANALNEAFTPFTAAFLVEPIQGESGIRIPAAGYLKQCSKLCKENNVLFLADEIQTGLGRTGKMLASFHDDVHPDGVMLGKALGGGLLPISLFLARDDVMDVFTPGDHGSTFGGNPLAAAVGLEALNVLIEEGLIDNAALMGEYLLSHLKSIASPLIKEIRGKGLLIGVEIDDQKISARDLCLRLLHAGILTKDTHHTVIRFAPPLTITKAQIDEAIHKITTAKIFGT